MPETEPRFFRTAAALRRWFEKNHSRQAELWLGLYKAGSARAGVTYEQALEEALCFGWIDGVRKRRDEVSYAQRFSPRTARSYWSAVNIARAKMLIASGRMHASGVAVFQRRDGAAAARYSFERQAARLERAAESRFRANPAAWAYFQQEAPWYRRVALHWVTSAKREETRERRLATLVRDSEAGRRIGLVVQKKR
jgi:uncharacterized protein YdeI (YjbR/CyaY-like superfamily)